MSEYTDSSITEADFIQWKQDKVTQQIFTILRERVSETKEAIASPELVFGDQRKQACLLGYIDGLNELLNISIEDTETIDNENA